MFWFKTLKAKEELQKTIIKNKIKYKTKSITELKEHRKLLLNSYKDDNSYMFLSVLLDNIEIIEAEIKYLIYIENK